ncbi:MAG: hypothetical protein ACFFCM_21600, partial [Promethearchaeota archaeon]
MNEEWKDTSHKIGKNKKTKLYRSTKRKIKKLIPKEKDISHITILDDKWKEGKRIIDTEDITMKAFTLSSLQNMYFVLRNKLYKAKEELRLHRRELPGHIQNIEETPKRIEELKKLLNYRK